MKKDKFIELAKKAGFPVGEVRDQFFDFEAAVGFKCSAFIYLDPSSSEVMSVQLFCGFANQPSLQMIDAWNREMRFVKALTSPRGELVLEMDLVTPPEMSAEHLKEHWRIWNLLLSRVVARFAD